MGSSEIKIKIEAERLYGLASIELLDEADGPQREIPLMLVRVANPNLIEGHKGIYKSGPSQRQGNGTQATLLAQPVLDVLCCYVDHHYAGRHYFLSV